MNTTAKKITKRKTTLSEAEKKKVNYVIDPETGEKISRTGLAMRRNIGSGQILDMRAVLK